MTREEGGADNKPNNWGVCAALACAVNGVSRAVLVIFVGDTEECFELVFSFLEGTGIH